MVVLRELRRRFVQVAVPALGVCILAYFVYHSVQGDYGLLSLIRLGTEVERAHGNLATLTREREALERKVGLLQADGMNMDMLEERSRSLFHILRDDEVVIFAPPPAPPESQPVPEHAPALP